MGLAVNASAAAHPSRPLLVGGRGPQDLDEEAMSGWQLRAALCLDAHVRAALPEAATSPKEALRDLLHTDDLYSVEKRGPRLI